MNRKEYDNYWKEKIGYEYKNESVLYLDVCGQKKCGIKNKKEHSIDSYWEWRGRVYLKYEKMERYQLEEFYHYLKLCKRDVEADLAMYSNVAIPLTILLLGEGVVVQVLQAEFWHTDSLMTIFQFVFNVITKRIDAPIPIEIYYVLGLLFGEFVLMSVTLIVFVHIIRKGTNKSRQQDNFYTDYIEIIKEMIDRK